MKKPIIIGITSAHELEEGLLNYHRTTLSIDYTKSVIAGGGIPIIIPVNSNREVIKAQLEMIDGLILAGGEDINPALYNQDFKEGMGICSPERDECEMIVLEEFLKTGKPILAICRGLQLANIYYGGTLLQDMRYYKKGTEIKHSQSLYPDLATHKVFIKEDDNILYNLFGKELPVNSFHHQAIDELGKGLDVIASAPDGIIEAFQKKDHKFFYGVQWHPEMMTARGNEDMRKIFEKFIERCEK